SDRVVYCGRRVNMRAQVFSWAAVILALAGVPIPCLSGIIAWTSPVPQDSANPGLGLRDFRWIFTVSDGFLVSSADYGNGIFLARYDETGNPKWSWNSSTPLADQPRITWVDSVVETPKGLVTSGQYYPGFSQAEYPMALVLRAGDGSEKAKVFPPGPWSPAGDGDFYSLIPPGGTSPWPLDIGVERLGFGTGLHWKTGLGPCEGNELLINRAGAGPVVVCDVPQPAGPVDTLILWSLDTAGVIDRAARIPIGRNTMGIRGK